MKIVDEFLPSELHKEIMMYTLKDKSWSRVDSYGITHKYEKPLEGNLLNQVRQVYREKVNNVADFGIDPKYFSVGIVKCEPGYAYPFHVDIPSKVISSVVYLSPLEGDATIFTSTLSPVWRPNRLVSWKNESQEHCYHNTKDLDRYTLNIYQMEQEVSYVVETV